MSELSSPRRIVRALAVAGASIVVGASVTVGGSLAATSSAAGASTRGHDSGHNAVVTTEHSEYGTVLANRQHRTVYLLTSDTRNHSTCSGTCAGLWPPLLVKSKRVTFKGVEKHLLGAIPHGKKWQVTYAGHPLY
ncbi:MAG: COG4315 family predicted lipoprotein, partial [Acidimicrobiales bacterium]